MMHSLRLSTNSFTLKVRVPELAKLLAEAHGQDDDRGECPSVDDDWCCVEAGGRAAAQAGRVISHRDAMMLARVPGASADELRAVCDTYTTDANAREVLLNAARLLDDDNDDENDEQEDPWCFANVWRETVRMWQQTSATPPPCLVQ